jgi:hypothetical protein
MADWEGAVEELRQAATHLANARRLTGQKKDEEAPHSGLAILAEEVADVYARTAYALYRADVTGAPGSSPPASPSPPTPSPPTT